MAPFGFRIVMIPILLLQKYNSLSKNPHMFTRTMSNHVQTVSHLVSIGMVAGDVDQGAHQGGSKLSWLKGVIPNGLLSHRSLTPSNLTYFLPSLRIKKRLRPEG